MKITFAYLFLLDFYKKARLGEKSYSVLTIKELIRHCLFQVAKGWNELVAHSNLPWERILLAASQSSLFVLDPLALIGTSLSRLLLGKESLEGEEHVAPHPLCSCPQGLLVPPILITFPWDGGYFVTKSPC